MRGITYRRLYVNFDNMKAPKKSSTYPKELLCIFGTTTIPCGFRVSHHIYIYIYIYILMILIH
jgi:hypothetical protein